MRGGNFRCPKTLKFGDKGKRGDPSLTHASPSRVWQGNALLGILISHVEGICRGKKSERLGDITGEALRTPGQPRPIVGTRDDTDAKLPCSAS